MGITDYKLRITNRAFVFLLNIICLFGINSVFAQFTIPEKPSFQTSVYDYANLLSPEEKTQLEEKLVRYSDSTTTQIVVATIDDLKGESIDVVSTNWAQNWGIGQTKEDNGVFILVSKNDRKISIRPGYGVEDKLIAATCKQIIDYVIVPEFKKGSYYKGLSKGADVIIDAIKGKFKGERKSKKGKSFPIMPFIVIIIVIIIIASKNRNNRGGGRGGGMDLADIILLSSLGRSSGGGFGGFGGGSSGGGGFGGGFGGGGFSGGGASGGW